MSSSTHLCLKQSQKSNWWYLSITFIKILSRDECVKISKQKGPNHRHKQILIPSTFRCYEQHWQVLHQFFWLMKMFPISFSQILIRHHVHKFNPSKDSLPTFFKVIFCFTWRGSGPLSHDHHLMDFENHVLQGCFSAEEGWPDCWGLLKEGQWACPDQHPSGRWNDQCHHPSLSGLLHHHPWGDRTRWHQSIPAELPTSWLGAGTHVQSSPDLWKVYFIYWRWTRILSTVPSNS